MRSSGTCYLIMEDDDGLAVVQDAFVADSAGEDQAILAEMAENPDLAAADGTTRVWCLRVPEDGERPEITGYSGRFMAEMRVKFKRSRRSEARR